MCNNGRNQDNHGDSKNRSSENQNSQNGYSEGGYSKRHSKKWFSLWLTLASALTLATCSGLTSIYAPATFAKDDAKNGQTGDKTGSKQDSAAAQGATIEDLMRKAKAIMNFADPLPEQYRLISTENIKAPDDRKWSAAVVLIQTKDADTEFKLAKMSNVGGMTENDILKAMNVDLSKDCTKGNLTSKGVSISYRLYPTKAESNVNGILMGVGFLKNKNQAVCIGAGSRTKDGQAVLKELEALIHTTVKSFDVD